MRVDLQRAKTGKMRITVTVVQGATGRLVLTPSMAQRFVTVLCMARRAGLVRGGGVGVKRTAEGNGQAVASQEHCGGYLL